MRNRDILFIIKIRNEAKKSLRGLGSDLSRTARTAKTAAAGLGGVNTRLKVVGASAVSTSRALGFLQRSLIGLGIGIGLVSVVRTLADFSQAMSTIRAVTGATETQFQQLRQEAKKLGASTRFSATEAADGMLFLSRAGFEVNEVLAAIGPTLDLATAGALGLGRAADIASNILQGFRLEADETTRVVDVLAFTANNANTTVEQLGDAMKFVAPVAAGLGVSVEETAAALGALSDAGLQASLAGTGLRRVLSELESPNIKTIQILKLLGLTTDEVRISQVGLTAAVEALADAGIDTGLALELFGDRGGPAFEVLSSSIPKIKELFEEIKNGGGTARRTAKIMDENLQGALRAVRSAFEAVVIAFGDLGAESALEGFLRALATALRFLADNAEILRAVLIAIVVVLATRFGPALLRGTAALFGFTKGVTLATVGLKALKFALRGLGIFLVIEGFITLIALFSDTNTKVREVNSSVRNFAIGLAFLRGIGNTVAEFFVKFADSLGFVGDALIALFDFDFTAAEAAAGKAGDALGDAFSFNFSKNIRESFADLKRVIGEGIDKTIFNGVFGDLAPGANEAAAALGTQAGAKFANAFVRGVQGFGGLNKFADALGKIIENFAPAIAREREQVEALKILEIAALATAEQLETFGITQEQLAEITAKVTAGITGETDAIQKAINAAKQRIDLLDIEIGQRSNEKIVLDAITKAKEDGTKVDEIQIEQLRERLRLAQQLEARDALREDVSAATRDLRQQAQLLGKTEEQRRRILAIQELQEKARKAGLQDITKEVGLLNRELDILEAAEEAFRGDAFGGATEGLRKFAEEAGNLRKQFEDFTTKTLSNLSDAITEFAETGKFSIKDFVNSALSDLQRIASKQIVGSLAGVFAGADISVGSGASGASGASGGFGGLSSLLGSIFHEGGVVGGVVGGSGPKRAVSAATFANARRYHRGGRIGPNEVPIIAQKGEVVLTDRQGDVLRRALSSQNVGGIAPINTTRQAFSDQPNARDTQNNVTISMTINTPDVAGFRRNERQIGASVAAATNRALRRDG